MSSAALKLAAGAVLGLSIAGKVAGAQQAPVLDQALGVGAAARSLAAAGYDTRIVTSRRSPPLVVDARRGTCRIVAGEYPPHGTFDSVYRTLAAPIGRLAFVHRGTLSQEAPKLRGLLDFYIWRELNRVGIDAPRAPVIAVVFGPGCGKSDIDWRPTATVGTARSKRIR